MKWKIYAGIRRSAKSCVNGVRQFARPDAAERAAEVLEEAASIKKGRRL